MNKKIKIALIIGGSLALVGIGYLVWKKYFKKDSDMSTSQKGIILLGGLDNRANDKSIEEQVNLVREGSNYENILGFRYNDLNGTIKAIEENPTYSVILFSAGCRYSFDVAKKMKEFNNIKNLYLAEPYGVSTTHTNNAKKSVDLGLPEQNIFVGSSKATGLDIVNNPTKTSNCTPRHWCSLTDVGKKIKSNVN